MNPDWIMAIIALAAILSPAIVSIIDNIFKYRTRKLEILLPNQEKALNDFALNAIKFFRTRHYENNESEILNYNVAKNNLYIYFKNINEEYFEELDSYQLNGNPFNFDKTLSLIIKELSQQIHK